MTSDPYSGGGPFAAIARALGISPRACLLILKQEGATPDQAEEALRRILRHPAYRAGAIRSPAAFFRGVLRGVQGDLAVQARKPPPLPPASPPPRPNPLGRIYFRAHQLFLAGSTPDAAALALRQEFPDAPEPLVHDAISWAAASLRP